MKTATAYFFAFVLCVASLPAAAVAQQHRGSAEDQAACTPDVYRLCSQEIPDEDDIVACLERKKTQLSPACAGVFSQPDGAPKAKPKSQDNSDD